MEVEAVLADGELRKIQAAGQPVCGMEGVELGTPVGGSNQVAVRGGPSCEEVHGSQSGLTPDYPCV